MGRAADRPVRAPRLSKPFERRLRRLTRRRVQSIVTMLGTFIGTGV